MSEETNEYELDLIDLIKNTPNDMELGHKLRLYYIRYGNGLKVLVK
jgi:hypothetical protein